MSTGNTLTLKQTEENDDYRVISFQCAAYSLLFTWFSTVEVGEHIYLYIFFIILWF